MPDHLTCLLRNLYAGQEATVRTGHGTTGWFQTGKEYVKAIYCIYMYIYTMTEDEMTDGMTEDEMVGWHHRLNGHEFG